MLVLDLRKAIQSQTVRVPTKTLSTLSVNRVDPPLPPNVVSNDPSKPNRPADDLRPDARWVDLRKIAPNV